MDINLPQNQNDHDAIVILCNEMKNIKILLQEIKDTTITEQSKLRIDVENLKLWKSNLSGKIIGASSIISAVVTLIIAFAFKQFGL